MAKKYDPQAGSLFKKEVPKMPEGYYSGDKPNPNLRAFVEQHIKERPYDPETDVYEIQPMTDELQVERSEPVYEMHSYWSKKPPSAIDTYIKHYSEVGDVVLDPFCGSGTTMVSALRLGRNAIGIDLSPAATFIASGYVYPFDTRAVDRAFKKFLSVLNDKCGYLYDTHTSKGDEATIVYIRWSSRLRCPRCMEIVTVRDAVQSAERNRVDDGLVCPVCAQRSVIELLSSRRGKLPPVPVEMQVITKGTRRKEMVAFDGKGQDGKLQIKAEGIRNGINRAHIEIPQKALSLRLGANGYKLAKDAIWPRASVVLDTALTLLDEWNDPIERHYLTFLLSSMLMNFSVMYSDRDRGGQPTLGRLSPTPLAREINPLLVLKRKHERLLKGIDSKKCEGKCLISTQSATDLSQISSNSIDYVFTDPPYGDKIDFWELNLLWEAWLGFNRGWDKEEVIINKHLDKGQDEWFSLMKGAFAEIYRVLKPGRWLSLCYHDTSEGTWEDVKDIASEVGFIPDEADSAVTIGTAESRIHIAKREGIIKRDIVVNFRKPKPGETKSTIAITGNEDKTTFNEKVRQIIRDYLDTSPGSTKDRVYDEVVSRMVRTGQMEAHDFNELLAQVAEEAKLESGKNGGGRWYLKETELVIADAAENAREDGAAEKIGVFIKGFLKKNLGDEGVHYSDLFEHYIYAVKDKPRRQLAEFLPDYFYKTEQGTWRLPASEEEEKAKREARVKGLGRRVKRYIAQLEQGAVIPDHERPNDATLAEWIRHCKRAGLYEQGKLLYEKGGLNTDNLPEEAMVNVEEDYQVCVRMIARGAGGESPKKRKRKGE